jgi:hypothetical protein
LVFTVAIPEEVDESTVLENTADGNVRRPTDDEHQPIGHRQATVSTGCQAKIAPSSMTQMTTQNRHP